MSRAPKVIASPRILRLLLVVCALGLATCESLWTPFQGANPNNCVANPNRCPEGQVCNPLTKLCEDPPTTLSLVAGGLGAAGDGVGAGARFNIPSMVVADGVGNVYVSDCGSYTIRKIEATTGVVSTLVGLAGASGSADGIGATARFSCPLGLALDGAGALYVSDHFNHTIRKVDVGTGAVTTLAGAAESVGSTDGVGPAARFNKPSGLALDGAGALYVADYRNYTIRKVDLSTGVVSTIAGTAGVSGSIDSKGSGARFYYPSGIVADRVGALYVTDSYNYTVRKIVLSTGDVTTLAGAVGIPSVMDGMGTAARFNNPYGIAIHGPDTLYVADYEGHTIRKVVASTGVVTTLAGKAGMAGSIDGIGTAASFNGPHGLAADGAGALFVTDRDNHTIRKITLATAAVTTLAGTAGLQTTPTTGGSADGVGAAARFSGPRGCAFDGPDTIYVADAGNHTIRKVVGSTGEVTTLAGAAGFVGSADSRGASARFSFPTGVVPDGRGALFIADHSNHTIRKIVLDTGDVSTIAGKAGVSGFANGRGSAAQFTYPYALAFDGDDTLYVADSNNHMIRRIKVSTGDVDTLAGAAGMRGKVDGPGGDARFNIPSGITFAPPDTLYVADGYNHILRKIQVSTGAVSTLSGAAEIAGSADGSLAMARFNFPYGIAFDGAGTLYISDRGNRTIRKLDLKGGAVSTVVGIPGAAGVRLGMLPGRLNEADGVAVSPTGQLFISETVENAILRVD